MLTTILAHQGQPPVPHDLWDAWNLDPLIVFGLVIAGWVHHNGEAPGRRAQIEVWRSRCFVVGLVVIGVALISPLDALASALASAHMVQHVLLLLVAAPLLAFSSPFGRLFRGSPVVVRRRLGRWPRRIGLTPSRLRVLRLASVVWLAHVAAIWIWHGAVPYGAALRNEPVHIVEHASFLITGVLFWAVILRAGRTRAVSRGYGALLVFAMAMQSVILSALLTFARGPWYDGYSMTTRPWGLEPLADQQLAGVIMWVPAGAIYLAAALALIVTWLRESERADNAVSSLAGNEIVSSGSKS